MAGSIRGPMGAVLTPQLIGIEQGLAAAERLDLLRPLRGGLPGPHPAAEADALLARGAVRPRPGPADRPLRPGVWASLARRPALYRLAARIATRRLCGCSARAGAVRCAPPLAGGWTGDAGPAGAAGTHLHEPVAGAGPPVSARDAILARIRATPCHVRRRRPKPRPRPWRDACDSHPRNLIPARGQLDREGRVQLFAQLAKAVMSRRAAARDAWMRCRPRSTAYLRRAQPAAEAGAGARAAARPLPSGTASPCCASAAARPSTPTRSASRWRSPASPRPARWCSPPPQSARPCWPTCPRPASWCSPPTGSRRAYEEAGNRSRAMPGGVPRSVNFVTGPSRTARHRPEARARRPRAEAAADPARRASRGLSGASDAAPARPHARGAGTLAPRRARRGTAARQPDGAAARCPCRPCRRSPQTQPARAGALPAPAADRPRRSTRPVRSIWIAAPG